MAHLKRETACGLNWLAQVFFLSGCLPRDFSGNLREFFLPMRALVLATATLAALRAHRGAAGGEGQRFDQRAARPSPPASPSLRSVGAASSHLEQVDPQTANSSMKCVAQQLENTRVQGRADPVATHKKGHGQNSPARQPCITDGCRGSGSKCR